MAGVTGQQGMLTPSRHLIPPPVYPGVSAHAFSQSHAFSQFVRKRGERPHTYSKIARKRGIARKYGLTLGLISRNCEKVWNVPHIFLKNIVSVFENGLFAFLTVNLRE